MPLAWVEPAVFLEHGRIKIYHIYKNDDAINNGPRPYWYSVNIGCSDADDNGENGTFDVRELTAWNAPIVQSILDTDGEEKAIKVAIYSAIDTGEIKRWEDQ